MEYNKVKEQVKEKLPVPRVFTDSENLLEMGLSSLMIMRLVNQWRKEGVKVSFGSLMEQPTFEAWWRLIQRSLKKKTKNKTTNKSILPPKDMTQAFPLTDVQYAYWVGRGDEQALGGVGCHAYLEFDGEKVDAKPLEEAWNQLQYHHPMLRACFLDNGMQKVLPKPYSEEIKINDFSSMSDEEAEEAVASIRDRLSHRKLQVEKGEVARIELTQLPKNKTRLHINIDLLIADVQSLQILLRDLATAYQGKTLPLESKNWNFAAYLEKHEIEDKEEKDKAKEYWKNRLKALPKGPDLPLVKRPEEVEKTIFNRRIIRIEREAWENLKNRAKEYQTTPAMVLLTAYAVILERWSRNKRFLINLPFFNRKTDELGLEEVIADFTTLLLLEINCEGNPTFLGLLNRIEKQLHEDMKYTAYSGVQVQRDLAQMNGGAYVNAPIVFACNLGTPLVNESFKKNLGRFSYMISQTPQVWNDFQSYEDENGVLLTWDSVDALFPKHMLEDMMKSLEKLLYEIGKEEWDQHFDVLPESRKKFLEDSFNVGQPAHPQCLHTAFLKNALEYPSDIALEDTGKGISISYGMLRKEALKVAYGMIKKGIRGRLVAFTLPRGYEQIVAVLGILISGNIYLPMSCDQPKERRKLIYERTGVNYVVTNQELSNKIQWPEGTEVLVLEEMQEEPLLTKWPTVSPTDSAYIIMTSGSTGIPKGVEIAHGSAWNTIKDINEKYKISREDTVIAISSMDFDLSVYDVFGILGVGGTLVLVPEKEAKNADYWLEQVKKYHVTIWNSVPVLLDMLLIRAESKKEKLTLRIVMLSGDWIGMDLPKRVATLTESCRFVAMGGATEASIWSNYQNVTLPLPKHWKSIPYGRPLKHQTYRVVDAFGRDCPYWVEGELWIGGYGVAKGYRNDPQLTEEKFITDNSGRWYKTGDLGRLWHDGTIEFLGRKDHQVKIRGHRIELGEIEHALQSFAGVRHAVVDTYSDGNGNKSLVAFIGAPLDENSGVTLRIPCSDILKTCWKRLVNRVSNWKMTPATKEAYEKFLAYADKRSLQMMIATLKEMGIFTSQKPICSVDEIESDKRIARTQKNTVLRWLKILKEKQILKEDNGSMIYTEKDLVIPEIVEEVESYFKQLQPYLRKMLTGEEEPLDVFYQKEPSLAPNMLLRKIPGHEETVTQLTAMLKELIAEVNGPIRILEIGTRDFKITKALLNVLIDVDAEYTYADSSKYFLQEAQKEIGDMERIAFKTLNLGEPLNKQSISLHSYDIVISFNSLHRNLNAIDATKKVCRLLKPKGIFLLSELVAKTYLQDITASFLENGFADIVDKRKDLGLITPDFALWHEYLAEAGLLDNQTAGKENYGRILVCCRQKESLLAYSEEKLRKYLLDKLPDYMVPKNYHFMEGLPSLSNGKIDRKQLKNNYKVETAVSHSHLTQGTNKTEEKLLNIWKTLFGYENIGIEDNYFTLGGDSLLATKLIGKIQKVFGCKLSIGTIFEQCTVKSLAKVIDQSEKKADELPVIQPDIKNIYEPFPLTDVQYAYWIGRSGLYDLGNVATHCYFELDAKGLDEERAEQAWNQLIQRHGMMRVIIQHDGKQRILEKVPKYKIPVTDIRMLSEENKLKMLEEKRSVMSHQIIQTEEWPLFDVQITKIMDNKQRIHISFDNIIFDGWSMFHILNEWAEVYRKGNIGTAIKLSFRDYVMGLEQMKTMPVYERDKKYWEDRLENFSLAPDLPIAKNEKQITKQRFCRRSEKLPQKTWQILKKIAGKIGVTPSVLLMSAYAETLRLWSSNKDFTINLTQFDRKPLHPDVNNLVGDFTTLTLLEICHKKGSSFSERTKAIQKQLSLDMEHSSYSAIEIQRALKKKLGNRHGAIMPIVFTSGLGVEQWNEGKWLGKLNYNISQTPQVWLDHQIVEMDGDLYLFWDSVDELFYPGMLDEMFEAYINLLQKLTKNPEIIEDKKESLVVAKISKARKKQTKPKENINKKH